MISCSTLSDCLTHGYGVINGVSAGLQESGRLIITRLLVNAFRTVIALTPQDLLPVVYLCTGQIAPSHEGIELGIGDAILIKVRFCCMSTVCKQTWDTSSFLAFICCMLPWA